MLLHHRQEPIVQDLCRGINTAVHLQHQEYTISQHSRLIIAVQGAQSTCHRGLGHQPSSNPAHATSLPCHLYPQSLA